MSKPASEITMAELLDRFPWAKRALFQKYHIGGCASCGFADEETLGSVCARNGEIQPEEVLQVVQESHAADEALFLPSDSLRALAESGNAEILDIRTTEEFEAVHIPGSRRFDQDLMQEILNSWPKDRPFVIVDHTGDRSLDAASYFLGHGFDGVRCLRGGIDAYSREVDPSLPRYTLEPTS